MPSRPAIPANIALQLRQEACFGCSVCGVSIIDYHHIIPWEEEEHFRPEDMMVLCPTHHRIVSAWPREKQYHHKKDPCNKSQGFFAGQMYNFSEQMAYKIGETIFIDTIGVIKVHDEQLLSFHHENGQILIDATIYNKKNDLVLKIERNEWKNGNDRIWDFIQTPTHLKVRSKAHHIVLEVDMRNIPFSFRGRFWKNGTYIELGPRELKINGTSRSILVKGGVFEAIRNVFTIHPCGSISVF